MAIEGFLWSVGKTWRCCHGAGEDASSEKMICGKMLFTLLPGNRHTQMNFEATSGTITTGGRIQNVLLEKLGFYPVLKSLMMLLILSVSGMVTFKIVLLYILTCTVLLDYSIDYPLI